MPTIWPYVRFSSEEQKRGDSLLRQRRLIEQFASRPEILAEGAVIDWSLDLNDLGVSGYTGRNLEKGRFKAFLEAVDKGVVKEGDYLAVEALNRITRLEPMKSLPMLISLIQEKGIRIAITASAQIYRRGDDISSLYIAIGELQRGYKESQEKGQRVKSAWASKKARAQSSGEVATSRCPLWLKVEVEDGRKTFREIPENVAVVKEIFRLSDQNVGAIATARILNEKKTPLFSNRHSRKNPSYGDFWQPSYVKKILDSKAVLGIYQPMQWELLPTGQRRRVKDGDEIHNYFPKIVSEELFERTRLKRKTRAAKGPGNKGRKFSNLFTKLAFCSECGATANFVNKGAGSKGGKYLVCYRAKYGECNYKAWRYEHVEAMLLRFLAEVDVRGLLSKENKAEKLINEKFKAEALLDDTKTKLEEFKLLVRRLSGKVSDTEREVAIEWEEDIRRLSSEIQLLDRDIILALEQQNSDIEKDIVELKLIQEQADEHEIFEIRSKIHERIGVIIQKIVLVFSERIAIVHFRNGVVRYIHELGVFGNIHPKPTHEQIELDMKEIELWFSSTPEERMLAKESSKAESEVKIVPLKLRLH